MAVVYIGIRDVHGCRLVFVREQDGCSLLIPYDYLPARSTSNYDWPWQGPARRRLALSILRDVTRDNDSAEALSRAFERCVLQYLHPSGFWLEHGAVEAWVQMQRFVTSPAGESATDEEERA